MLNSFEMIAGASHLSNPASAPEPLSTAPQSFRLVWMLVFSTIAFAFCLWWIHLLEIIYERQGIGWGRVHLLCGFFIAYQILANYWTVSLTNPGYLKNERERGVSHWSNHGIPEGHSYCTKCNIVRPPRAHHCKRCNRCCLRMDHHCQFIDKCVGELNYVYYLRCVFWGFIFTLYGLTTTLFNMQHGLGLGSSPSNSSGKAKMGALKSIVAPLLNQLAHLFEPSTSTEAEDASASSLILRFLSFLFHVPAALFSLVFTHRQAANFMFFLLSGGFFAFIAPLIVYHVQLVARGQTTVEHAEFLTRFKRQQSKRPASLLTKVFGDGSELAPADQTEDQGLLHALRKAAKRRRKKEAQRRASSSSSSGGAGQVQDGDSTSTSSSSESERDDNDNNGSASDDQAEDDNKEAIAAVVVNDCPHSAGGLLENAKQLFGPSWWRELLLPTPLPIRALAAFF